MGCRGCRKSKRKFKEAVKNMSIVKENGKCEHGVYSGYWCKECEVNIPYRVKPLPKPEPKKEEVKEAKEEK